MLMLKIMQIYLEVIIFSSDDSDVERDSGDDS